MTSILGPYYSPTHWYPQDEEYMRQLDSAWVNIHQPSARAIQQVQDAASNARIMLRSWDIDDHDGDRKREMYADPRGAARKHLEMWRVKWDELVAEMHRNGWQAETDRWYISLVNEPDPAYVPQVVEYSLEACSLVRGTLIHLGLIASSVGTFAKPSEGDYGWTQFIPLEKPINDGGHILLAHEYWQPEGPSYGEDGGNLAWRHHSIPLDVPILIRESGANGYIYGRYSKNDDSGWQKTVKDPNIYAAQVKEFIEGCDTRVKGVLLYMLDFHDDQWWSFNTQPAMHQLLAIKDARPQKPSPFAKPVETHLPAISKPESKPQESTMGIIDPLVGQTLIRVESGGRAFGPDDKPLIRFENHIFKSKLGNDALYERHFQHGSPLWTGHRFRHSESDAWQEVHTGNQASEYAAFGLALSLNRRAAYESISMGLGQIMGFNAQRVGFASAAAMFAAFHSESMQVLGFINFFLSDPELAQAVQAKDWRTIARLYNGSGNVDNVAPLLESTYNQLQGA